MGEMPRDRTQRATSSLFCSYVLGLFFSCLRSLCSYVFGLFFRERTQRARWIDQRRKCGRTQSTTGLLLLLFADAADAASSVLIASIPPAAQAIKVSFLGNSYSSLRNSSSLSLSRSTPVADRLRKPPPGDSGCTIPSEVSLFLRSIPFFLNFLDPPVQRRVTRIGRCQRTGPVRCCCFQNRFISMTEKIHHSHAGSRGEPDAAAGAG